MNVTIRKSTSRLSKNKIFIFQKSFRTSANMPKTSKKVFTSNFTTLNCVNKRKVVILLNKTGEKSLQEIANHVGLSESGVRKILKRYRGKNSFEDKPRSERPVTLSKQTQKNLTI